MGTYAEIIGLPGSGKSVFYKEALRHLGKNGVRVFAWKNGPLERRLLSLYLNKYEPLRFGGGLRNLWVSLKDRFDAAFSGSVRHESALLRSFLYSHTELAALILSILIRRNFPPWEKELILGRYFDNFTHLQIARSVMGEGEAILTDPGLIQRGIALLGYRSWETEEGDLYSYLRLTPLPDVLISVRVPPEVCLSRMQQRSFPRRLRGLNERDVMASLDICWTYQSMAEEEMQKRGAALIHVQNEGPLPSSLEQLHAGLHRVGLGP